MVYEKYKKRKTEKIHPNSRIYSHPPLFLPVGLQIHGILAPAQKTFNILVVLKKVVAFFIVTLFEHSRGLVYHDGIVT